MASGSSDGVSYNIGALFGAGLFVCAIVICLTIFQSSTEVVINANTVYRDIGFYIAAALLVLGYAWYGKIPWWGAVSMLALYFVLVIVVWLQDKADEGLDEVDNQDIEMNKQTNLLSDYSNKDSGL